MLSRCDQGQLYILALINLLTNNILTKARLDTPISIALLGLIANSVQ